MPSKAAIALALLIVASFCISGASAEDFYRNKQIRLIAGFPAGNDYDLGARVLVKYLPKYIPGQPSIIVQNMPQAASVAAANYLYTQAPRDGTVLGSFSRHNVNDALTAQPNVEIDPRRMNWLGAAARPARVCVRWYTAPVKTPADLFRQEFIVGAAGATSSLAILPTVLNKVLATKFRIVQGYQGMGRSEDQTLFRSDLFGQEFIVGAAGATSSLAILPTVLNKVLGTKFRIVQGYQGMGDSMLAVERGELQGLCASYQQFRVNQQLIKDGKLTFLLRAEEAPIAAIPDVPSIFDYAKTDEQRQLMRFVFSSTEFGRPYVFPPEVPKDRVDIMRKAIADAVHDPELVAEAANIKMDMTYTPPDHLEQLVAKLYQTPPAVIETGNALLPNKE